MDALRQDALPQDVLPQDALPIKRALETGFHVDPHPSSCLHLDQGINFHFPATSPCVWKS